MLEMNGIADLDHDYDVDGVTFGTETYAEVIADIKSLLISQHKELGLYQDKMPLDPEWELYRKASEASLLRIYTVRIGPGLGKLIGYALYFIKAVPHYKSTSWAIDDVVWLDPTYRGNYISKSLFNFIEMDLKAKGVFVMHTRTKADHPALAHVLASCGHTLVELGFQKRLD